MIDIHSHIIYDVDDGSKSLEQSIKYLKEAKKAGVNKVVCTPHMSRDNKEKALKIVNNFKILRQAGEMIGVDLYLGNEIMYKDNTIKLLKEKKLTTLNRSKYVLVEFKRGENRRIEDIISVLSEFVDYGFIPILAHPELYVNLRKITNYQRLKENGILLQINATSLVRRKSNFKTRKFARKLLKERMVDFVASDTHCTKKRNYKALKKAYKFVRKMDKNYANIIFLENQLEIVGEL